MTNQENKIKLGKRKQPKEAQNEVKEKKKKSNEAKIKHKKNSESNAEPIKDKRIKKKRSNEAKTKEKNVDNNPEPAKEKSIKKKAPKFEKSGKTGPKIAKPKKFSSRSPFNSSKQSLPEKVEDWNEFKKQKKELKLKRIQARTKDNYDKIQQVKKMGEHLRLKLLKPEERTTVTNKLNNLLKGNYAKFVLAHDTARVVQWLLKYSDKELVNDISKELIPVIVNMLHSKYGIHCIKRLLKYGHSEIRASVIDQMQGHAVKLATHSISASLVEYAYSTWATSTQKQLLIQEFYGDLYKNSKDPNISHIRDVYKDNATMKAATLSACKANIKKVLNKGLLDSGLVQTVLHQFIQECAEEDKVELIAELIPHIVVISNSRDGSRVAMQCIWQGTNKQRKVVMKALKEHLIDLCKHEFGHCAIIALLDSIDDTVVLHKIILSEILKNAKDLAVSEWGRKVLLWLIAPGNPRFFHPKFVKEINEGREVSSSKKSPENRQTEILNYSISTLLNLIATDTQFWLSNASVAMETLAILKAGSGNDLASTLSKLVETIINIDWKIPSESSEILGIEHTGIHMVLKKLAQHDKISLENGNPTFGKCLADALTDEVIQHWITVNRGCFLLVAICENNAEARKILKRKIKPYMKLLKNQDSIGANVLLKNFK